MIQKTTLNEKKKRKEKTFKNI